jgi:predicted outer membrane repeat protein
MGSMRRTRRTITLLTAGLLCLLPASAAADTFTVNKHGDPAPGPCTADHCSLREAAAAATAEDGNDTIKLPSTKPYLLTRSESLPAPDDAKGDLDFGMAFDPTNDFKVVHPGSGLATIDASGASDRAIEVKGFLKLIKVKVRGGEAPAGQSGGGIAVPDGALLLRRSRVIGNSAPERGGGIHGTEANLVIKRSLIRGNEAADGGGILAEAEARFELERSTVTGNTASSGDGGGAWAGTGLFFGASRIISSTVAHNEAVADGGGVFAGAATFISINSTITKNSAVLRGGGIYSATGSFARLLSVTIARNRADSDDNGVIDHGGGIFTDGGSDVVEIRNSLLVKNRETAGEISECDAPAPVGIESLGGNLITSAAGCPFFDDPEDILDPNPGIAKLQSAGGPTQTVPLKAGSPAIDEADGPSPQPFDQRGRERDDPDIGAYER